MDYEQQIRARIGDKRRTVIEKYTGNGQVISFNINEPNPYGFEVTVGGNVIAADQYRYDEDIKKLVFIDYTPANEALIVVKYYSNAFTTAEISAIYQHAGQNVDQATVEALRQALGDQARMVSFQKGDRSVSLSDIFKNLMSLLDSYEKKVSNSGSNGSQVIVGRRTMNDQKVISNPDDISRLFF